MRDMSDIVTAVVEALCGLHLLGHGDIPCFVYGHELGALMAFEICRKVQAEFPMKALFVSSMSCPQVSDSSWMDCTCLLSKKRDQRAFTSQRPDFIVT